MLKNLIISKDNELLIQCVLFAYGAYFSLGEGGVVIEGGRRGLGLEREFNIKFAKLC